MLMAVSGTGPLWFIQVLWLLCLVLLLVRKLDKNDRFWNWCGKANIVWIVLLGVLLWVGTLTLVRNPRPDSADGLLNLYKPLFYMIPFLLGYFVFSHDEVQETLGKAWIPLLACAVISGGILIGTTFGQDNTSPEYLSSPLNIIYGWLMCLAMMAWFKARFDRTSPFATYMAKSSFGLYIVHYLVIAALGYMMKTYTQLPPWAMYVILTIAVFTLSPLLYEIIRRIPFVRWAVLGEKKKA
jgi:surface polysaccharide O-acyltransferase-like enzyme